MPATALARQPKPEDAPELAKRERIPPKIAKAVRFLVTGECKTQKAAAERAGLSATYLSEVLAKPKIQAFVARETRKTITMGTMRAGARLIELVDASSEHVSLDASKHILAIDGIRPPSDGINTSVNINIAPGYVINLGDPQVTDRYAQNAAKPLIEHEDGPHE